ncbi:MAG: glycosyltransferase family 39 protein [Bacteroidetes bacterium]|nr:MAG: glycosyltransferase family 39 protein [Bacteroidota bacterium]
MQGNTHNTRKSYIIVAVIGILLFISYLGSVHLFDWDEVNFAEAAREMLVTGDYLNVRIDYEPFHEKPPLFFWCQALSMKIFGVNEFAARFPNALIGIITLLFIFHTGKKIFDEKLGLLWVLAYIGSILPHFYFKTGLIDPLFNLFIIVGMYYSVEMFHQKINLNDGAVKSKYKYTILAGVFIALAIMTKGPAAYLLVFLSWLLLWFFNRRVIRFPFAHFIWFTLIAFLPSVLWYLIISMKSEGNIFQQFISYQLRLLTTEDASHGGPFYYHFVVLLLGCFPASVLAFRSFRNQSDDNSEQKLFKQMAIVLLCVVLGVFTIVETKIIHYSSLAYLPLTFLAAYSMYSLAYREMIWKKYISWLVGIIGILWAMLLIAFPIVMFNIKSLLPKINDEFTKDILSTPVHWNGFEFVIGAFYLIAIIFALILFKKRKLLKGFIYLFASTSLVMFTILPVIAPKIDRYTQGTAIEFYKQLKGKDCYVHVLNVPNYKYGHLFYIEKPMQLSAYYKKIPEDKFEDWLINGNIDKPAYFICRAKDSRSYLANENLKPLYAKNGFMFLVRYPVRK